MNIGFFASCEVLAPGSDTLTGQSAKISEHVLHMLSFPTARSLPLNCAMHVACKKSRAPEIRAAITASKCQVKLGDGSY